MTNTIGNAKTDRARVRDLFAALRREGYFARMNFECCQSCAWAEAAHKLEAVAERGEDKGIVFFDRQDAADAFSPYDNLHQPLYLAYGSLQDSEELAREVAETVIRLAPDFDLEARWDGDTASCVLLTGEYT